MTSDVSLVVAFVGMAAMALAPRGNLSAGRLLYWAGALITCVASYFVAAPQGWKSATGAAVFVFGAVTFIAYAYTPFLKIKGRRASFYSDRPQPYGAAVTAAKSWWRALVALIILMFGVLPYLTGEGNPWLAAGAPVAIILIGAIFGHRDAVLDAGIASGQRLQLILAALVTVGVFAVAYFCGYYGSRLWASTHRDHGRHSR
jgi:hypothetical protein